MFKYAVIILMLLSSGCAVGPLVTHEPARTVGAEKNEFTLGYGSAGYVGKWTRGINDNLDFGIQLESLSLGAKLKYAFINNQEKGFSLSTSLGLGSSLGGSYYYGDLAGSYLNKKWEPYTTLRVVRVKTDPVEFKDEDTGEVELAVESEKYVYGQYILGVKYLMTERWSLSLEGSTLFGLSSGVEFGDNVLVGLAANYKF